MMNADILHRALWSRGLTVSEVLEDKRCDCCGRYLIRLEGENIRRKGFMVFGVLEIEGMDRTFDVRGAECWIGMK
jgi:hypothetical protein